MAERLRCIVMGAAGRDFHDFLTFFRDSPYFHVSAFTAAQIPFIEARSFPQALAGPHYAADIPIRPEQELAELIRTHDVDVVFLAYSDLSHAQVMEKASIVQACGAAFALLGPKQTQLRSRLPVIAVTAVRTGAGKSPLTQWLARRLIAHGRHPGVIRHPMPYGDIARQTVERFASFADLDRWACTIEEREEYVPYVEQNIPIYAGVDYRAILAAAEAQDDVILWDGGNNDYAFVRPDLSIVVADALRPGQERGYYPGEANFRAADVIVIAKVRRAPPDAVASIRRSAAVLNPGAPVVESDLVIDVSDATLLRGRRVLVVEDAPTVTHGGMAYGAGFVAATEAGAAELIDPRPAARGTIVDVFEAHRHLGPVLPACGYSDAQRDDLAETIAAARPDVIVDASPASLARVIELAAPVVRVRYRFEQLSGASLEDAALRVLA